MAVLVVGMTFGLALAYQTSSFIGLWGWRGTFKAVGGFFSANGIIDLLLIKEPKRGQYTFLQKGESANKELTLRQIPSDYYKMLSIPCISLILVGTFFSGAVALGFNYYILTLINLRDFNVETYSVLSGAIMFVGGLFGNIFYAKLCDNLEPKVLRIKSYVAFF